MITRAEKISFSSSRLLLSFFFQLNFFYLRSLPIQLDRDHARALLSIEKILFSSDLSLSLRYSVKTFIYFFFFADFINSAIAWDTDCAVKIKNCNSFSKW